MKFSRLIRVVALSAAFGGAAFYAHAQSEPAAPAGEADPVLAKVNGEEIRRSDALRVISTLPPQVQMMPPQMIMPAVVDQIINGKLIAQQGYERNLQDEAEVKERLKRAEERFVQEMYLTREVEERITPERIEEAYKVYLEENPPKDEVRASHILVESEEEARQIIGQLEGGADFAELAREKSKDPAAAQQGGDLGYFSKDQMVEPFAEAAFAMEPGALSETPVQTQFGWHVIKVEDKRKSAPPTQAEVEGELKSQVSETIIAEMVESLRGDARIERFGEALPPEGAAAPGAPEEPAPAEPQAQ
jgi:peptidyl-prolyl cis-trans isomerase C